VAEKGYLLIPSCEGWVSLKGRSGETSLRGHRDGVQTLAVSPDTKYLLSGSRDQTVRIWSLISDTLVVSLFFAGDEWIAWTPEGYYAASPGGEQFMGWQVNNGPAAMASYYPASQFRKSLYRPDVIKRLLDAGSLDKALADADAASGQRSQRTEVAQVLPPKVTITTPSDAKVELNRNTLEIKAVASSVGKHPVTTLRLLLDGRPAPDGLKIFEEPQLGEVRAGWTLEVPPGSHRLTVQASNAVSKAVSDAIEVVTVNNGNPAAASGSLYVLAIGINDYPYLQKRFQLDSAAPDARSLRQVFLDKGRRLFRSIESRLLLDRQATQSDIRDGLKWLAGKVRPGDVAVVFFAGHGDVEIAGQFYILPTNAQLRDLAGTAISGEELERALGDLPCPTVLMLDACYSGSFDQKKRKTRSLSKPSDALEHELIYDAGLVVFCGARYKDQAIEEQGHGYFTQALVEGLSGQADSNDKDGVIEVDELKLYVTQRVRKLSDGEQVPTAHIPSTVESFPLSKP